MEVSFLGEVLCLPSPALQHFTYTAATMINAEMCTSGTLIVVW